MRYIPLIILSLALLITPGAISAQVKTDTDKVGATRFIKIDENGALKADGMVVQQIAGKTFYTRIWWGEMFMRMTVRTNDKTVFTKKFGESITVSEIKVGDVLSAEGTLVPGSDRVDIDAILVKNWSDQTGASAFSGNITETSPSAVLKISSGDLVVLNFDNSSVIKKGNLTIQPSALNLNDKILSASGVFDHASKKLTVSEMKVYQNMSLFVAQNYEGIYKGAGDGFITVSVGSTDYSVRYTDKTSILRANRSATLLSRFVTGDKVRFYGIKREAEQSVIDATIIRNLNL